MGATVSTENLFLAFVGLRVYRDRMNYDGSIGSDREYDDDLIGGDSDLWDEYDADDDEYDDGDPGWADGDHDSAMTSIGWGTDEDYGYYGEDDGGW
jgi:hypothetical protein